MSDETDQAIENIEKMVRALELAQQVIKDLHQAVRDLQAFTKQQDDRLARLERTVNKERHFGA